MRTSETARRARRQCPPGVECRHRVDACVKTSEPEAQRPMKLAAIAIITDQSIRLSRPLIREILAIDFRCAGAVAMLGS